jgi:hypothetical protein
MAADRRAQVLAVLEWLASMRHLGYEWAEKWRGEYAAELRKIDAGKEQAA